MTTGEEEFLEEIRASRELMRRFRERHAELVARMPEGVRSCEDAAVWAEFYLAAAVGPESDGCWGEEVVSDGGNSRSFRKHVELLVWRGLGTSPRYDDELPKPNREQIMWLLWQIADPPDLDSRAATWQAAAWAEEVLPNARYDAYTAGGFRDADEHIAEYAEMVAEGEKGEDAT